MIIITMVTFRGNQIARDIEKFCSVNVDACDIME